MMKNKKGFSIVELLVVVSLIALISVVATYSISTIKNKIKQKSYDNLEKKILIEAEKFFKKTNLKATYVETLVSEGFLASDSNGNVLSPIDDSIMNCYLITSENGKIKLSANDICDYKLINQNNLVITYEGKNIFKDDKNNIWAKDIILVPNLDTNNQDDNPKVSYSWSSNSHPMNYIKSCNDNKQDECQLENGNLSISNNHGLHVYQIKASVVTDARIYAIFNSVSVHFDNQKPDIDNLNTDYGIISFDVKDDNSGIKKVELYSKENGEKLIYQAKQISNSKITIKYEDLKDEISIDSFYKGEYFIRAVDNVNNVYETSTFSINLPKPELKTDKSTYKNTPWHNEPFNIIINDEINIPPEIEYRYSIVDNKYYTLEESKIKIDKSMNETKYNVIACVKNTNICSQSSSITIMADFEKLKPKLYYDYKGKTYKLSENSWLPFDQSIIIYASGADTGYSKVTYDSSITVEATNNNKIISLNAYNEVGQKASTFKYQVKHDAKINIIKIDKNTKDEVISAKLNLVLALDVSGSMIGSNLEYLQNAANNLIEKIDFTNGSTVSIITFTNVASVIIENSSNKSKIVNEINSLTAVGGTSFTAALNASNNLLKRNKFNKSETFFIMISDGYGGDVSNTIVDDLKSQVEASYTIGIGTSVAENHLKKIATSDKHYFSTTGDIQKGLLNIFETIKEQIKIITDDSSNSGLIELNSNTVINKDFPLEITANGKKYTYNNNQFITKKDGKNFLDLAKINKELNLNYKFSDVKVQYYFAGELK